MDQDLRVAIDATGVMHIELCRPAAKNALTIAMRDGLVNAFAEARNNPTVRAVLISGAGDAFCAGMDLSASTVMQAGRDDFRPRMTSEALRVGVQAFIKALWQLDKPTVAAVHGAAVGPGAHLALACDFVVVQPRTKFVWTFPKWGLVVDAGGAYLLPRLVGLAKAKALVMLGESINGEDAVNLGLAYQCVGADAVVSTAQQLAERLAAGPTRSLGLSKRLLNASFETDINTSLELEGHFQALATASPDLLEGMAAFREKRDAGVSWRLMFTDSEGRAQRIAAYGVCVNARRELLLCRLNDTTMSPGVWTLPGGGIDFGEHPDVAVVRECEEETGLIVEVRQLLTIDSMRRDIRRHEDGTLIHYHAIRILYEVEVVGGTLRHEQDNSTDMAAWHTAESMGAIPRTDVADLGRSFTTI